MKRYKVVKIDWDAWNCDKKHISEEVCMINVADDVSESEIKKSLGNPDYDIIRVLENMENF